MMNNSITQNIRDENNLNTAQDSQTDENTNLGSQA